MSKSCRIFAMCLIYLHFSQECVYVGDCRVEDVRGEIIPDLQTSENVWGAVSHSRRDPSSSSGGETSPHLLAGQQRVQLVEQWVDLHNYLQSGAQSVSTQYKDILSLISAFRWQIRPHREKFLLDSATFNKLIPNYQRHLEFRDINLILT